MIAINRNKVPAPEELTKEGGAALAERTAAIAWFQAIKRGEKPVLPHRKNKAGEIVAGKKTFEFKAYNSKEIKKKLKELFNGKCAYCESEILVVTVGDIEHYRPKAEILDENKKKIIPGYYWLATDWNNLLLACNNCNRKSTQELVDGGEEAMGKGNQFPIVKAGKRCLEDDQDVYEIEKESRLLLNPCMDEPEKHLTYLENGAIQAKLLKNGQASEKGETSIKVYALHRKPLADKRLELIKAIKLHIVELLEIREDLVAAMMAKDKAREKTVNDRLERKMATILEYKDEKKMYCAVARQIIDPFLKENGLI